MSNYIAEGVRAFVQTVGQERPDRAWLLSDYDTWERNPYYRGPKCLGSVHPEDDFDEAFWEMHKDCKGGSCKHGFGDPKYGPVHNSLKAGRPDGDDGIPF